MFSADILTALLMLIIFILALSFAGRFFEKISPGAIRYLDYGSFALAVIAGGLMYFGVDNIALKYLFFISIIVYFVTLRHSIHKNPSAQE